MNIHLITMDYIAPDILVAILTHLHPEQIYSCLLACKRWKGIIGGSKHLNAKLNQLSFNIENLCCNCQNPALYRCSCQQVKYCSSTCQRLDWQYHQTKCVRSKYFQFRHGFNNYIAKYDPTRPIEFQVTLHDYLRSNIIRMHSSTLMVRLFFNEKKVTLYPTKPNWDWDIIYDSLNVRRYGIEKVEGRIVCNRSKINDLLSFIYYKLLLKPLDGLMQSQRKIIWASITR